MPAVTVTPLQRQQKPGQARQGGSCHQKNHRLHFPAVQNKHEQNSIVHHEPSSHLSHQQSLVGSRLQAPRHRPETPGWPVPLSTSLRLPKQSHQVPWGKSNGLWAAGALREGPREAAQEDSWRAPNGAAHSSNPGEVAAPSSPLPRRWRGRRRASSRSEDSPTCHPSRRGAGMPQSPRAAAPHQRGMMFILAQRLLPRGGTRPRAAMQAVVVLIPAAGSVTVLSCSPPAPGQRSPTSLQVCSHGRADTPAPVQTPRATRVAPWGRKRRQGRVGRGSSDANRQILPPTPQKS